MADTKKDKQESPAKAVSVTREEFDGLAAKVRRMSDNWKKFADGHLGSQTTGGKLVGLLLVVGLLAGAAIADDLIKLPTPSGGTGFEVDTDGNATVGGTLTVDGATTQTGTLTASALMAITPVSVTCTNGGSIAVAGSYIKVTPIDVATASVANATSAGQILIIENVGTNALTIADSTTAMALGANAVLGATDTLVLIANAAAQWRELSLSDN